MGGGGGGGGGGAGGERICWSPSQILGAGAGPPGYVGPPLKYWGGGGLAPLPPPPLFLRLCSLLELVWSNSSGLERGVHFKENQPCQFHFCTKFKLLVKNGGF